MVSSVGSVYYQAKGKLNHLVDRLVNRVDERLRNLEGMSSDSRANACRWALSQVAAAGWLVEHKTSLQEISIVKREF